MSAVDRINMKIERLRSQGDAHGADAPPQPRARVHLPPTIQHATAEICLEGADLLSADLSMPGDAAAGTGAAAVTVHV